MQIKINLTGYNKFKALTKKDQILFSALSVLPVVFLVIFTITCFDLYFLNDDSMQANIAIGTTLNGEIDRGDGVLIETENGLQIRRVIGLPGDTISFDNGRMYINGKECEESYVSYVIEQGYPFSSVTEYTVGESECFVLADNRNGYEDSRFYGCIDTSQIIQKIIFKI